MRKKGGGGKEGGVLKRTVSLRRYFSVPTTENHNDENHNDESPLLCNFSCYLVVNNHYICEKKGGETGGEGGGRGG